MYGEKRFQAPEPPPPTTKIGRFSRFTMPAIAIPKDLPTVSNIRSEGSSPSIASAYTSFDANEAASEAFARAGALPLLPAVLAMRTMLVAPANCSRQPRLPHGQSE